MKFENFNGYECRRHQNTDNQISYSPQKQSVPVKLNNDEKLRHIISQQTRAFEDVQVERRDPEIFKDHQTIDPSETEKTK